MLKLIVHPCYLSRAFGFLFRPTPPFDHYSLVSRVNDFALTSPFIWPSRARTYAGWRCVHVHLWIVPTTYVAQVVCGCRPNVHSHNDFSGTIFKRDPGEIRKAVISHQLQFKGEFWDTFFRPEWQFKSEPRSGSVASKNKLCSGEQAIQWTATWAALCTI